MGIPFTPAGETMINDDAILVPDDPKHVESFTKIESMELKDFVEFVFSNSFFGNFNSDGTPVDSEKVLRWANDEINAISLIPFDKNYQDTVNSVRDFKKCFDLFRSVFMKQMHDSGSYKLIMDVFSEALNNDKI